MMSIDAALAWSIRLVGVSLALQSLELLRLGRSPLRLVPANPSWIGRILGPVAGTNLGVGVLLALTGDPRGLLLGAPLAWVVAMRFGGTFNGGSDYMTMVVALPVGLHAALPTLVPGRLAVVAIGIQWLLSYTIAGIAKVSDVDWRNGQALSLLSTRGSYSLPPPVARLLSRPRISRALGHATLTFECAAPLALLDHRAMLVFAGVALTFHAAVALTLGLNRFFWAWLAAMPCGLALPHLLG